jgi:hypothetical protein
MTSRFEESEMNTWNEIVTAWANWVNNDGPPVQFKYDGKWHDHCDRYSINRSGADDWRVKSLHRLARMLRTSTGDVVIVMKPWGAPCPETIAGEQWLGQWEEVPE